MGRGSRRVHPARRCGLVISSLLRTNDLTGQRSGHGLHVFLQKFLVLRGYIDETHPNAKPRRGAGHRALQSQLAPAQPEHDFELGFERQGNRYLDETTAMAEIRSSAPDDGLVRGL